MFLTHVHILFIYKTLFIHGTWYQGPIATVAGRSIKIRPVIKKKNWISGLQWWKAKNHNAGNAELFCHR